MITSEDYKMYSVIKVRVQVLLDHKIVTSLDIDMRPRTFRFGVVTDLMFDTSCNLYAVPFIKSTANVTYEGEALFYEEIYIYIVLDNVFVSIEI